MATLRYFDWQCADSWQVLRTRIRRVIDIPEVLASEFDGIVGYHACRPLSVRDRLESGLLGHDEGILRSLAHAVFGHAFDPKAIDESYDGVTPGRPGLVYLALDRRTLLEEGAHYLLYGSEQLCGVAAGLDRDESDRARQLLLRRGTPVVLKCTVPWRAVPGLLGDCVCTDLAEAVVEELDGDRCEPRDFTFVVKGRVLPEWIVAHSHTERLFDQVNGSQWRGVTGAPCDACEWRAPVSNVPKDPSPKRRSP